ncbi:glycogen debranching protein GlgX [Spirilliplanes yamanashiensis]|uniref:Glycogen debranching enzyme n=1 Tax=Spirilliplanes yamanashiensis TaxID=42233 RepID=A0A8J4DMF2_9ACTN|nr:glycogen debranching protein GlgX [Spirilliplanes yamanashiensis]MDP9816578.1 glycogen operon protein [Spirilliplanes yamanashiensis]GIJ06105.1 glycogen debranching enzyme [Spirilliplanes yamanashiensis]
MGAQSVELNVGPADTEPPRHRTSRGRSHPLGARPDGTGVNIAVFSEHATAVQVLLFDRHDSPEPYQIITLDPEGNRTFAVWHVHVDGLRAPAFYGLRVFGPEGPGLRFQPDKVLADPYARGIDRTLWDRGAACRPGDNTALSLRSVVVDESGYDWAGDEPLDLPMEDLVIYEAHVGGFTRSPTSGVAQPGTFAGLVEKIPYLKDLGVTAVELLPVFDFDDSEARTVDGRRLTNYWGYSTAGYFAPHAGYCVEPAAGAHVREFRDMVKALHAAGIEVILDVVFNHTDEGNHLGPLFSFAGLDNPNYYYLDPADPRYYYDYSGCGNTLMANHPIVTKMIVECLEYWVREMHVDGFRFDEAAVLTRGARGEVLDEPPVVWQIELSDTLADTKIIAEAWDAAGAYEVGRYPGYRWADWNGRYRDTMRRFVKGEPGLIGDVATRLTGSADLYQPRGHRPINSVNFVTCHDGFTLADLVSYDGKHNEANGEGNRDGNDDNMSWNCGVEGPTDDPAVLALRLRQSKNLAALLLLSRGVPMMLAGDEAGRTQQGNNNAYCQDNEIGWLDWSLAGTNAELLSFWQRMIAFRAAHPILRQPTYDRPDVTWHGTRLGEPGWDDPDARALACTLSGLAGDADLHVITNMYWGPLDFELPERPGRVWARAVDTSLPAGSDLPEAGAEPVLDAATCTAPGRSVIVLISRPSA